MEKPIIASQIERLSEIQHRVFAGEYLGLICFSPPGTGKTVAMHRAEMEAGIKFSPIQNATKFGVIDAFLANPHGHFWFDDYDAWMNDEDFVNVLKAAFDPQQRTITVNNANTIRTGDNEAVPFHGTLSITSNANPMAMSKKMQGHIAAMRDRLHPVNVSWDDKERLKYIDWWVCENDYFRTKEFNRGAKTKDIGLLSLIQIQDVLNYIHKNAARIPLTLRMLNDVARERKLHPNGWEEALKVAFESETPTKFIAPKAPRVKGWTERHDDAAFDKTKKV